MFLVDEAYSIYDDWQMNKINHEIWGNKNRHVNTTLIIYLYFSILSLENAIMFTELQPQGVVARVFLIVEILLFLFVLLRGCYTKKTLVIIVLFSLYGLLSYVASGYTNFIKAIMSVIVFQGINDRKGFKYLFLLRLWLTLSINMLAITGVINLGLISVTKSYGSVMAYGLGYDHPNRYAYSFIYIEIALLCWKYENVKLRDLCLIAFVSLVGYFLTRSRTLIAITGLLLVLVIGYKSKHFNKLVKWVVCRIGIIIYPLLLALSLVIPYIIANNMGALTRLFTQLNRIVSARFTIITRVFEFYKINLFGGVNEFSLLEQKYNYSTVDNGYIRLLFIFGVVGIIVYLILVFLSTRKLIMQENYIYPICFLVVAVWGLSEHILIDCGFNITILFWSVLLTGKNDTIIPRAKSIAIK